MSERVLGLITGHITRKTRKDAQCANHDTGRLFSQAFARSKTDVNDEWL